jgi:hypothetical protein
MNETIAPAVFTFSVSALKASKAGSSTGTTFARNPLSLGVSTSETRDSYALSSPNHVRTRTEALGKAVARRM